jgi:hypothetical protein
MITSETRYKLNIEIRYFENKIIFLITKYLNTAMCCTNNVNIKDV